MDKKFKHIGIRVTEKEYDDVQKEADKVNRNKSNFFRWLFHQFTKKGG